MEYHEAILSGFVVGGHLVLDQQALLGLDHVPPLLAATGGKGVQQPAACLHRQLYVGDDQRRREVRGSEGQNDLPFRVGSLRYNLFGFPGDLVVFEGIGRRDALAIHDQELSVQVHADVDVVEAVLPLFIDFVFEGELHIAAAHFPVVDEEKGDLLTAEGLLPQDVVQHCLRPVSRLGLDSSSKAIYFKLPPSSSSTEPAALGDTLRLTYLGLFQNCR